MRLEQQRKYPILPQVKAITLTKNLASETLWAFYY